MRKQFCHLLLTRFNTAINFAPSAKRLEADWLTGRLALFERYCLPSVAGQEGAEFHWLVFLDAASPGWFKAKIATFEPLVEPIYIDGPATDEVIARKVRETGLISSRYLITTRIDNDDAISRDHLASVQNAFQRQDREFITFPFGLQSFRGHLYGVYWPSNPFLSLIEKVGDGGRITTVFCVAHDRVGEANKLRKVRCSSQWLQVLHDSNVANALRGWPRLDNQLHPEFCVVWPEQRAADSFARRLRFSSRAYLMRVGRLITNTGRRTRQQDSISGGSSEPGLREHGTTLGHEISS
jgi:putative rhamnosyltransferase